jgi:hypothetical protein
MPGTQSATARLYIDFLQYSSQSLLSWRKLQEEGDKNPYDDEGSSEAKMKAVRPGCVTGDRDWKSGWGGGMAQDVRHSWAWRRGPAEVSKTDEVSAHTVRGIGITLYQGVLQREGEV